jgi:AcrR family transcriptional regulator
MNAILAAARVTKGALYHHFDSKEALGYAVVDEVLASISREKWVWPLQNAKNPIDALVPSFRARRVGEKILSTVAY